MKPALPFEEISRRLHALDLPPAEGVVGILTGGLVPSMLLAHQLRLPWYGLRIRYRAEDNEPLFEQPRVESGAPAIPPQARLLLVDDVCVSGQTLQAARQLLGASRLITVVLKGQADHVLFPEVRGCVTWPWKTPPTET